jgi:hypothetical protein
MHAEATPGSGFLTIKRFSAVLEASGRLITLALPAISPFVA